MTTYVIDASVAAKVCLEEAHSDRALRVMSSGELLIAPDLIWLELANVLWKYESRGLLSQSEALENLGEALELPLRSHPSRSLLPAALLLAMEYERSVYDAVYLALAIREECQLITADERLARSFARSKYARLVRPLTAF